MYTVSVALPTWPLSTVMFSQRGRKVGGPGVEGVVRRFTSISALRTEPRLTWMLCSNSGRSATRPSIPSKVRCTRRWSISTRSTCSPRATVPLTPLITSRTGPSCCGR